MQIALLVIGGVGVLLLVVSLVAGELVDGLLDGLGSDILSGLAIATFLGAFGFVGALTLDATDSTGWAVGAGLAAGVVVGVGTGSATRSLMKGGDEHTVRTGRLVGISGSVIDAIPEGGLGQITVTASGHITRLNARADEPIPSGTAVTVTEVLSPTSVRVARR
jgi:membrane protein implicated in regulation of membrane protease activity